MYIYIHIFFLFFFFKLKNFLIKGYASLFYVAVSMGGKKEEN